MNIKYEIKEFNPVTGVAAIRYYTDIAVEGMILNIDIPIDNGSYITGEPLINLIKAFLPRGQLERLEALATVSIPTEWAKLVKE